MKKLQSQGYPVSALAIPLGGLASDIAYLDSYLETVTGPVVLAGHSYAGSVISGTSDPKVKALVFLHRRVPTGSR